MERDVSSYKRRRVTRYAYADLYKSLHRIIEKHGLNPDHLIDAFIDAWRTTTSQHNEWTIRCRQQHEESSMFLITSNEQVIAQFPVQHVVLKDPDRLKRMFTKTPHRPIPTTRSQQGWTIAELQPGMRHVTITGTVQQISPKNVINTRWGNQVVVANATIADATGTILFSLWNTQIDRVQEGDQIEIRNGYTISYRGALQIRVGRKGSYQILDTSSS